MSVAMRKSPVWPIKSPHSLAGWSCLFRESWAWAVTVIAPTVTSFTAQGALLRERMNIISAYASRELPRGR